MSSWAKPGVKCVCIWRGKWGQLLQGEVAPIDGQILTVRSVEVIGDKVGLTFCEIRNPPGLYEDGFKECAWLATCFKPLVEQADDVALFAHHLERVGEPA